VHSSTGLAISRIGIVNFDTNPVRVEVGSANLTCLSGVAAVRLPPRDVMQSV
jgi:metal-dependent HD superfamily phosphatase/phosphodiesterase